MNELIDLKEIATLFGVSEAAPRMWRYRGLLPEPAHPSGPVWERAVIIEWGVSVGKMWPDGSVKKWDPETRRWL